jgi:hypothetical protein
MWSAALLGLQRLIYCLANVFSGGRVIAKFANSLRDENSQEQDQELDEGCSHLRPISLKQGAEGWCLLHHGLDGLGRVSIPRGSFVEDLLEADHPSMRKPRSRQNLNGVPEHVERAIGQFGQRPAARTILFDVRERDVGGVLYSNGGAEHETATGTECWEPHDLTVGDLAAFAVGLAIGFAT